jgi:hypothetical protein
VTGASAYQVFACPVYKLPDMTLLKKVSVPEADNQHVVNDVSITNDGQWLIAVGMLSFVGIRGRIHLTMVPAGDDNDVWIFDTSDGNYTYKHSISWYVSYCQWIASSE